MNSMTRDSLRTILIHTQQWTVVEAERICREKRDSFAYAVRLCTLVEAKSAAYAETLRDPNLNPLIRNRLNDMYVHLDEDKVKANLVESKAVLEKAEQALEAIKAETTAIEEFLNE